MARRNSRFTFYSALGVQFGSGAGTLEHIFKENVIEMEKIRGICLRFDIPVMYRSLVWKVILGVIPVYKEAWAFIEDQREQQFKDTKHFTMLLYSRHTSYRWEDQTKKEKLSAKEKNDLLDTKAKTIASIYSTKEHHLHDLVKGEKTEEANVERLAKVMCSVCEEEWEAYWCLTKLLSVNSEEVIQAQIAAFTRLLEAQQSTLHHHLVQHSVSIQKIVYSWFSSLFTSVISSLASLQRIWDKIIGGNQDVISRFGYTIIVKLKPVLLDITQSSLLAKKLTSYLDNEINIDQIISSAMLDIGIEQPKP